MNKKITLFSTLIYFTLSLFSFGNAVTLSDAEKKAKLKVQGKIEEKINAFTSTIDDYVIDFAANNLENLKYLDFDLELRENYKPTFRIMSVTEIKELDSGTFFNQTSLNTHDEDQTINIGFGMRKLINDNKIILGSNYFYDHQFSENHSRQGVGAEAISSVFDIRGNYYDALSGTKETKEGTEQALDGWDTQLDYHLPGRHDVSLFVNAFKFKSRAEGSSYEEIGNKFGANATLGHLLIEAGYYDDNQATDSYFGSVKYVVQLGEDKQQNNRGFLEYTDVSEKLYQPVKRENKIRVVKITGSGVEAAGF